ncbi:hypothetical protein [Streptomyces prunicolor]|uniref:hypothetical protein n=1 Tax=Streptomyces prunicolor TaxID=67348 RepID=UPI00342CD316
MSRKLSTNGFSIVEIIVIIFVVAALGVSGFFVWQKTHKKETTTKSNPKTSQTNQDKDTSTEPADPSDGGKYLAITEWGVRFPLPENMRGDVTYGIAPVSSTNHYSTSFEVGKIANLAESNCKLYAASEGTGLEGGIGVQLIRSPEPVPASEGIGSPIYTSKDGKYYFYAITPKGLCSGDEQAELAADDALMAALKDIAELTN